MCIVCVFHAAIRWDAAPTPWTTMDLFRPLDAAVNGECYALCVLFLANYLPDLCSLQYSLVQYLYVWSVVNRTHGVPPCMLVSTHPTHVFKYPSSTHVQSFCTEGHAGYSLFAWLVLIYVLTRIYIIHVYSVCFPRSYQMGCSPNALDNHGSF